MSGMDYLKLIFCQNLKNGPPKSLLECNNKRATQVCRLCPLTCARCPVPAGLALAHLPDLSVRDCRLEHAALALVRRCALSDLALAALSCLSATCNERQCSCLLPSAVSSSASHCAVVAPCCYDAVEFYLSKYTH
jgi:hypothetical protein